ncbi:integrase core domain-containing protein [Aquisalimonas asiatica]|uniref:integrase core domain-containing protein n=1 Tax=Aquisalimonas asiatica TaxID=406100 RepID=UPI001495F83C|nr:DDE-type integrase/transposase/recombinase [Aquisalimonas asiatica]
MTVEEARVVANLIHESTRQNGKRLLSFRDAIDIAFANGRIETYASPATFARVMREAGFHPDQLATPAPHVSMRSMHANHVWQFDVSICVLYRLTTGGLQVMEEKEFYKNKPHNLKRIENQRVLRYLVTDHFSGAFYLEYFQAAGEDQETLFKFLMSAFAERPHPNDPFHGVPSTLVWDAGSANQSYMIRNLLDRLQVEHIAHEPGNPRAKGQVERTHDIVERHFEGRLYMMRIESIEELNEKAHAWMRHFNSKRQHSRTKKTRYGLWQTIREDQLRICPPLELCRELLQTKPVQRKVASDLSVSFAVQGWGQATYSVEHVPGVRVGEQVDVSVNPYRAPSVLVAGLDENGGEILVECDPVQRDEAGFRLDSPVYGEGFHSVGDTDTDTHRKALAREAYGAETNREVERARAKREPAFQGSIDPISYLEADELPSYMRRKGTALDVPNPAAALEVQPLTHIEAMKRLAVKLERPIKPEENQAIRRAFPDGVPEDSLGAVVDWLSGGAGPPTGKRPSSLKAV